jgi:hypothetical protein
LNYPPRRLIFSTTVYVGHLEDRLHELPPMFGKEAAKFLDTDMNR